MVEPFAVMMSSFPSLSQSIRPAPPLIDSTMYFLSGEEICETVSPACFAMSSKWGTLACPLSALLTGRVVCCATAHAEYNRPTTRSLRMAGDEELMKNYRSLLSCHPVRSEGPMHFLDHSCHV